MLKPTEPNPDQEPLWSQPGRISLDDPRFIKLVEEAEAWLELGDQDLWVQPKPKRKISLNVQVEYRGRAKPAVFADWVEDTE